jgi:two-component system cell cycle response regulator DivK
MYNATAKHDDLINGSMKPKKKVLIVEDNELNLKLFSDLLEANDFIVIQNKDGKFVSDICKAEMPCLIIMDIQLPNISGITIIKELKSDDILKSIPIIAVTAFAMQEDKDNILASGCEEYLSKPISIASFIETVQKLS